MDRLHIDQWNHTELNFFIAVGYEIQQFRFRLQAYRPDWIDEQIDLNQLYLPRFYFDFPKSKPFIYSNLTEIYAKRNKCGLLNSAFYFSLSARLILFSPG